MPFSQRLHLLGFGPLLLTLGFSGWAQSAPPTNANAVSGRAAGYYEFEQGKLDELQAEAKGAGASDLIAAALQHYSAAMADDPAATFIALRKADLLSRVGRTDEAVSLVQAVVKDHPDDLDAHEMLAEIDLRQLNDVTQATAPAAFAQAIAEYQTLVRLEPTNADNHLMLGKLYGVQHQFGPAETEFRTAVQMAPNNDDAVSSLVQSLGDEGKLDAARQVIDTLPPVARTGRVYATLGDAYESRKQYKAAAAAYGEAVQLEADDPSYQRNWAQALMDAGDYAQALVAYQKLMQETPNDARSLIRVAQLQQQLGQFPAAEQSLKAAGEQLPGDLEIAYTSALLQQSEGHDDVAIAELKKVLATTARPDGNYSAGVRNNRGLFLDQLGELQMQTGDYPGALDTYHQIETLTPGVAAERAQVHEIEAYTGEHDYTQAAAVAQAGLEKSPRSRSLRLAYANLLSATGKEDEAVAQINPLLQGTSGDWDLYVALGQIKEEARQWSQAEADATQAGTLAPDDDARAQADLLLGSVRQKQQHYPEAEAAYRQALALEPASANALNYLGYLLADEGVRLPEALGYIQQALRLDANNGAYLDSLGWVYFKMARPTEAVTNLERAVALDRNDPTVLDHLAQAYAGAGQLRQAESSWQREIELWKAAPVADYDAKKVEAAEKSLTTVKDQLAKGGGGQ